MKILSTALLPLVVGLGVLASTARAERGLTELPQANSIPEEAVHGTSQRTPQRQLKKSNKPKKPKSDSDDPGDGGDAGELEFIDGECVICTPDNKIRPLNLTVEYVGGPGVISNFQDGEKATCRDQIFPDSTTLSAYDVDYVVEPGTIFTFSNNGGDKMDAETDFLFATGEVDTCFIHTSCSQPLVVGDQIGPFIILAGNDCKQAICGDGIVDPGEECDDGANGDDTDGCLDDCTECLCEATGTYNAVTGGVTIDYSMCGSDPIRYDWMGIYPCDAPTFVADQAWWDDTVCPQTGSCGDFFEFGYVEGEEYVNMLPLWWSYTCGDPLDKGCQTQDMDWPEEGTITIDPSVSGAGWAFPAGRTLEPGCYKVLMNRDVDVISPPPYPTICAPWGDAIEFEVPSIFGGDNADQASQSALELAGGSGASDLFSCLIAITTASLVALFHM